MDYTPTEINRLAETRWGSLGDKIPWWNYEQGKVYIYRFMLNGGPPESASPSVHLSLLKGMAEVPLVDCEEYAVLGVTMLRVDKGTSISGFEGGQRYQAQDATFIVDVVFQALSSNNFWFDRSDLEKAARSAVSKWGGGYSTSATFIGVAGPASPLDLQTALSFWSQQQSLFYATSGAVSPQSAYSEIVNTGSLGIGLSFGLSDFPGRLVPMRWGTSITQPMTPTPSTPGTTTPITPLAPPKTTSGASENQGWLVMAACAVAGYVLFKKFTENQ